MELFQSPYNHIMIALLFLAVYSMIDMQEHFGVPNTFSNACYYTVTTHTTTGFGDITPKTNIAKWIVTLHMVITWTTIAIL